MTDTPPPIRMPLCDSENMLKDSSKKNGFIDEVVALNSISVETCKQNISDQKPIKISVSPFLQNNVISHELQETDICDNNSIDPLDCDRENTNNNYFIKSHAMNKETDEKCVNSDGSTCMNNNKPFQTNIENTVFNGNLIINNGESSLQSLACTSNIEKKFETDSVSCMLDFSKLKDGSSDLENRVPQNKCLDVDLDEESPVEDCLANEEYDNSAYNTEIQDVLLQVPKSPITNYDSSRRSSLKRKLEDDDDNGKTKKRRKNIQFDGVTVFYFPRSQGFNCVPSQGGSTLGMSRKHICIKRFSLTEHAAEQKRTHKEQILQSKLQSISTTKKGSCSSSEESEDTSDISDSEMEAESFIFLQPLPIRQRRSLLRLSGIRQIEILEKEECKDIRLSREMCGCQCKVTCYPETCQCAEAGIKCQVDRHNFPCGCTREGCGNESGRIEFNPIRVRTHFLQTVMRMEIEKRQSQWENDDRKKNAASWFMSTPATSYIQTLNSTAALANETSCSHMADASNLCVSFDLNQHQNKNTIQQYQGNDGAYNSNGCYMFCGNVSPFDSASTFTPSYCSTLSNFSSQNGFCHSCNSYSLSKLSSCSSPFSSNFPYSNATFAAAVAVVGPSGKNHYGIQNNLSFSPASSSSLSFNKINNHSYGVNDSASDHFALSMQAYNSGSQSTNKQHDSIMNENKNETVSSSYPKLCPLSSAISQKADSCSSAGQSWVPCNSNHSLTTQHFSQFKPSLSYFDDIGLSPSLSSCPSAHQHDYFSVANQFLDASIAKASVSRIPPFNNLQMLELNRSFISEKDESCPEFCHRRFTSDSTELGSASSSNLDENEKCKSVIRKVEDFIIPISSCSTESCDQTSSVCEHSSLSSESAMMAKEFSKDSENGSVKTHIAELADKPTTESN